MARRACIQSLEESWCPQYSGLFVIRRYLNGPLPHYKDMYLHPGAVGLSFRRTFRSSSTPSSCLGYHRMFSDSISIVVWNGVCRAWCYHRWASVDAAEKKSWLSTLALMDAYKAGFLHRDFSPGNVIISNGKGLLIDWDLSKPLSEELETPRRATRTVFTY